MEQLQELLEILKQAPEMALWGMVIYLSYGLLKLASWVFAIKSVSTLLINKYFNYKNVSINHHEANRLIQYFQANKVNKTNMEDMYKVFEAIKKSSSSNWIHKFDIDKAIEKIEGD